jgi:pyruvate dehydrogenase E2 component (dihydrolipoamide acetyltransferase)
MADRAGALHVEITGDPAKSPPVIFLHGFGGTADAWGEIAGEIGAGHPTMAYDLPGHHRSLKAEGIGGAGRMAKAILADLAARGVTRFHLVGHSMGGAVAALMALREGGKVASLTLLAPGGFGPEINIRLLERFAEAADEREARIASENMFGWNGQISDDYIAALVERRRQPGAVEGLKTVLPAMTTGEGAERIQGMLPADGLAGLAMPVKVVWGTQDRVLPTRQAHKLPGMFAVHVFDHAGHMLIEELPRDVTALIRQNLKTGG